MSRRFAIPTLLITLGLGACATVPQQLAGTYSTVTPDAARSGAAQGTRVRWGGRIIETEPQEAQTCFFVLNKPLDSQARPERDEQSTGRFVACKQGFFDPEVYSKGKELTVTGTLDGSVTRKIGNYDYTYPRVAADTAYLWPERPRYVAQPYPYPFYDPFFCDPFWSPWGCGPFFGPPVIVVHPKPPPPPPPAKSGHH
ncbi:MAG TPA: Slp family lipoprotein [Rhodanobacteraceae bacterium]|nr:Slp family lipoprotein [Rhodanobacteraceae bacterium]